MSRSLLDYARCIGLNENFSLRRDFFGYTTSPPWKPTVPDCPLPDSLSLSHQFDRLNYPLFHLVMFFDHTSTANDLQQVDCAIQIARNIYGRAGYGIGRVRKMPGIIPGSISVQRLVDDFGVDSDEIEVFFVSGYSSSTSTKTTLGETPGSGDGLTVALTAGAQFSQTGRSLAHELGHFLLRAIGRPRRDNHRNDDPSNLMCQSTNAQKNSDGTVDLVNGCKLGPDQRVQILLNLIWIYRACHAELAGPPEEVLPYPSVEEPVEEPVPIEPNVPPPSG